ncbi:MAG TPA: T9SS type A sorting domain-containing protein [Ignavibacteriaceae bacterium]|nr:T9SS type A sorting domain-containing protein [Ignavibacteriaceae bacterium]
MFKYKLILMAVCLLSTNLFSQVWTGGIAENSLGHIFVGAQYYPTRVLKSTDAGVTWTYSDSGFIEDEDPDFLAVDSKDYIFFAGVGSNIFRSTDGGLVWEFLRYLDSRALTISDNDYIYIGVDDSPPFYLARSTDSGNTWEDKTGSITKVMHALESSGSNIYAGGSSGHFYISSNYGDTWNVLPLFTQNWITEIFVNDSGHIFTGTWSDGAFVSKDNGLTWQKIFNLQGCIASIQASDNGYLFIALGRYVSSPIKIFRSSDNGITWDNTDNGLPTNAHLSKLFKASDNSLYITTGNGYGIYKSTDYGDNWFHIGPITDLTGESGLLPTEFSLSQNYPNPFNPSTNIGFRISDFGFVTLKVYDILGNEVATLVNQELSPGEYEVEFNPATSIKHPASGIYFYQLRAGSFVQARKMVLIK